MAKKQVKKKRSWNNRNNLNPEDPKLNQFEKVSNKLKLTKTSYNKRTGQKYTTSVDKDRYAGKAGARRYQIDKAIINNQGKGAANVIGSAGNAISKGGGVVGATAVGTTALDNVISNGVVQPTTATDNGNTNKQDSGVNTETQKTDYTGTPKPSTWK